MVINIPAFRIDPIKVLLDHCVEARLMNVDQQAIDVLDNERNNVTPVR